MTFLGLVNTILKFLDITRFSEIVETLSIFLQYQYNNISLLILLIHCWMQL